MTDTTIEPPLTQQLTRIDEPMERKRVGDMVVNKWAGLTFNEYREAIEFAKLMAQAKHSVPGYLRQNPGDCLSIVTQALRWHLEPYWVAQHSYIAKAEGLIAYDAAVHAAIVLSSPLLKTRPRYTFNGEGEERTCTVSAHIVGEAHPHEYTTPPLSQCRPPKNAEGVVKGSPLWTKDVDQQLCYYGVRSWGRRHTPELLGGVYDREEFEETTQDETDVIPPSPNLMDRLPGKMANASGFQTDVVDSGLAKEATDLQEAKTGGKKARKSTEKAQQEPKAVEGSPPTSDAGKPTAEPSPPPSTADQYVAYAIDWISKATDPDEVEARFEAEMEMRRKLAVPLPLRKQLNGTALNKAAELRKKPKKGTK